MMEQILMPGNYMRNIIELSEHFHMTNEMLISHYLQHSKSILFFVCNLCKVIHAFFSQEYVISLNIFATNTIEYFHSIETNFNEFEFSL